MAGRVAPRTRCRRGRGARRRRPRRGRTLGEGVERSGSAHGSRKVRPIAPCGSRIPRDAVQSRHEEVAACPELSDHGIDRVLRPLERNTPASWRRWGARVGRRVDDQARERVDEGLRHGRAARGTAGHRVGLREFVWRIVRSGRPRQCSDSGSEALSGSCPVRPGRKPLGLSVPATQRLPPRGRRREQRRRSGSPASWGLRSEPGGRRQSPSSSPGSTRKNPLPRAAAAAPALSHRRSGWRTRRSGSRDRGRPPFVARAGVEGRVKNGVAGTPLRNQHVPGRRPACPASRARWVAPASRSSDRPAVWQ